MPVCNGVCALSPRLSYNPSRAAAYSCLNLEYTPFPPPDPNLITCHLTEWQASAWHQHGVSPTRCAPAAACPQRAFTETGPLVAGGFEGSGGGCWWVRREWGRRPPVAPMG